VKPADRARACQVAADYLGWLTAEPWSRAATALDVLADVDRRVLIAAGSRDGTGRRSIGSHSDPTASAAGARVDAGASGRRLREAIRFDSRDITETAAWLRSTLSGGTAVPRPPADLTAALLDVEWCLTIPHAISAWSTDDDALADEVDHAVDHLARQCGVLHTRVRRVLVAAARPAEDRPRQKPRECCASCARYGVTTDIETGRYARMCRRCGDFRAAHKVLPTEAIVRMWSSGIDRVTPGMIIEAKAARTNKRRAKA